MATVYGFHDLSDLQWMGDDRMPEFRFHWDHVVDNIDDVIPLKAKRDLFYRILSKSTVLQEDLAHYRRAPEGTEDHTYEFLRASMDRHTNMVKKEKNVLARQQSMRSRTQMIDLQDAAPAVGKASDGKGGKTKGDQRWTPRP